MQNKFICEIVGINRSKVYCGFEHNDVWHEILLNKKARKKLKELNLLHPHAEFVVEQKDKDSEVVIRAWDKFKDADIEGITDFKDYDDALKKIKERYDKGLAKAYCPNATTVNYDGQKYQLAVVLGDKTYRKTGMKPHGMAHYLHKHTNPEKDKNASTEQELMQATKDVKIALQDAKRKKNIVLIPVD